MKILILITLLASTTSFAHSNWKDALICFGVTFDSPNVYIEVGPAIDQKGLIRQVYFQKTHNGVKEFVTDQCQLTGTQLNCESKKVQLLINVEKAIFHRAIWEAASYRYYPAEVVRKKFMSTKSGSVRCRL
jgi:hypothetical protein